VVCGLYRRVCSRALQVIQATTAFSTKGLFQASYSKMSNMVEISKGLWVPQGTAYKRFEAGAVEEEVRAMLTCAAAAVPKPRGKVIINPEDESDEEVDHAAAFKEMVRDAGRVEQERQAAAARAAADAVAAEEAETLAALEKERAAMAASRPRPLEPVAAFTHAGATMGLPRREAGVEAVPEPTSLEKAFKRYHLSEAEWEEVSDTTQPQRQAVFNCVKRYRFMKAWDKLIIEVELMSGTTLRHIIKLSQVKGILTKGHTRPYAVGLPHGRPEKEVIIDLRAITCPGYDPAQLKFKLSGEENALAFHLALMDAL